MPRRPNAVHFRQPPAYPGGYRNDNREDILGIFYQDSWKVRPNLTLTAGLRWSYFGPMDDKDDHMGVLSFGGGTALLTGITIRTGINAWVASKLNFGPELGFNWSPDALKNKLVVRGGFGLNYNGEQIANANNYDGNPPGTSGIPGPYSTGPTFIDPNILYAISSSPNNAFGYPSNPHTITTFNSAGLPTAGGAGLGGLPGHMPTQYLEHYSLDIEYDLGHAIVANLGYEGGLGRHQMYNYDATALGEIMGAPQNPLVTSVNTFGSGGWSSNNMMLAGLKHQFSHTFSADAQFTWAHSMDTNSGPYSRDPYLYNPAYSYGRSAFDVNRSFKLFGVWQPVIFHGSNNWMEKAVGGWSLSGIATFHSGFGWTPYLSGPAPVLLQQLQLRIPATASPLSWRRRQQHQQQGLRDGKQLPQSGYDEYGHQQQSVLWTTTSVFPTSAPPSPTTPGQSSTTFIPPPGIDRNVFPGPGYRDVDANLAQGLRIAEQCAYWARDAKIEIKANFFNLFNIANINPSSISTNVQSSNLGQASAGLGSRMVDLQARFSF